MIIVPCKQVKALAKIATKKPIGELRTDLIQVSREGDIVCIRATDGAGAAEIRLAGEALTRAWPKLVYLTPKELTSLCVGNKWSEVRFSADDSRLIGLASSDGVLGNGSQFHIIEPDLTDIPDWPDVDHLLDWSPSAASVMEYHTFDAQTLQIHLAVAGPNPVDLCWDEEQEALRWWSATTRGIINPMLTDKEE